MMINLKAQNLSRFLPYFLFSLTSLLFFKSYSFDFVYDDLYQIVNNNLVTNKSNFFDSLFEIFISKTFPGEQYRPIVTITYYIQNFVHGLNSSYYHLFNILLHGVVSVLVYYFVLKITSNLKLSFFSSIIFAIHPLQVESVASIVGRAEILACLFSLLALHYSLKKNSSYLRVILFFTLATLSKESAFTLVAILPMFAFFLSNSENKKNQSYWYFLFLLLSSVFLIIVRANILADEFMISPTVGVYFSENPLFHSGLISRIFPVTQIFGNYILLFLFPLHLKVDYSINYFDYFASLYSLKGLFLSALSFLYLVIVIKYKNNREVLFLLFFALAFSITINLLTPIGVLLAERLIYFPIIGLSSFISFLILKHFSCKISNYLLTIIIIVLALRSLNRMDVWKSNSTLFKSMQNDNPKSARANLSYGMYLNNIEKDYKEAKKYFLLGYKLEPRMTENSRYLSDIAIKERKFKEAHYWLSKVLKYEPNDQKIKERLKLVNKVLSSNKN